MGRRVGAVLLVLWGHLALATPAQPQASGRIRLGERVVDTTNAIEFRMPVVAKTLSADGRRIHYFEVQPVEEAFGQIGISVAEEGETLQRLLQVTRDHHRSNGMTIRGERLTFDPILGTSAGRRPWVSVLIQAIRDRESSVSQV